MKRLFAFIVMTFFIAACDHTHSTTPQRDNQVVGFKETCQRMGYGITSDEFSECFNNLHFDALYQKTGQYVRPLRTQMNIYYDPQTGLARQGSW